MVVNMVFVSELKKNYSKYGLPERFVDLLPEECQECGSPMGISETMTGLHCTNPRCKDKVVMRIRAICKSLGILDFGESTISKFVDYYGIVNPLNMFDLKEGMILSDEVSDLVSKKVIDQIVLHKDFYLWEFVQVANLPFIQTSARKIFQGYTSMEEALDDIEEGGVELIKEKLHVSGDENGVSIQAVKIYNTLMEYKDDLIEGAECVNIKTIGNKKELNVVCSDSVGGGFQKKKEFYDYIFRNYDDVVHVNFLGSVTKDVDYLIWAGADGSPARYTSKVQKVEAWNESGKANIPIMTARQFIDEMEEKFR